MTALSRRNQHSKRKTDKQATEQREAWKDRMQHLDANVANNAISFTQLTLR